MWVGSKMIIVNIISIVLLAFLLFWTLYNGSIIYAGIKSRRKRFSGSHMGNEETPKFSIIVPTKNEEAVIGRCLNSLQELDYPKDKLEIFVVDGNSADKTCNLCSDFSGSTLANSRLSKK